MALNGIRLFVVLSLLIGTQSLEATDPPKGDVVDTDPIPPSDAVPPVAPNPPVSHKEKKQVLDNNEKIDPSLPPSKPVAKVSLPTQGQIQDKKLALEKLAQRLADLYACVPGHKDSDYSTQSWYLVDSFRAWNNAVAVSVFTSKEQKAIEAEDFEKAFLERIKLRIPSLQKDAAVVNYAKSAALATEQITERALKEKAQIKDFSGASALLKATSHIDGKNIFQSLKVAHDNHVALLKKNTCANLGVAFFASPRFGVPSTSESIAASRVEDAKTRKRRELHAQIDKKFPRSERISAQLPPVKYSDRKKNGYYSAGKYQSARPHIVGNILKAAAELKEKGIAMGVADMNAPMATSDDKKVKTPGYWGRDKGLKATFMTLGPEGNPSTCGFGSVTCYSQDKTFEMVKALIDQDPDNVRRIEVANKELRKRIEEYLVSAHRYKGISANWVVRDNSEFESAINIEWKE